MTAAPPLSVEELGAAYLTCAGAYNKAARAIDRRTKDETTLKAFKKADRQYGGLEGDFIVRIRAIAWPAEFEREVRDVLKTAAAIQVTYRTMGNAESFAEYNSYAKAIDRQILASTSASNQLRSALGLPPPPVD